MPIRRLRSQICRGCRKSKRAGEFIKSPKTLCIDCKRELANKQKSTYRFRAGQPRPISKLRVIPARDNYQIEPGRFKLVNGEIIDTWE